MNKLFCKQFNQRELPGSRARTLIGYIPESTMSQDISKAEFSKKKRKNDGYRMLPAIFTTSDDT